MIGQACDACLRSAVALRVAGGHLEAVRSRIRPGSLLSLGAGELIEAIGGGRRRVLSEQVETSVEGIDWRAAGREPIISACRHRGAFQWPRQLVDDPEPPHVLFAQGDTALLDGAARMVAIVGARRANPYGRETARSLAGEVASAGGTIVSGLALGIDACAHRGALDVESGRTVAVVGGGLDRPYPATNAGLHAEIGRVGCLVSEMPPGSPVWRWSFPARNRLIAALSSVVTVVQASLGSGSLHTADAALERGRLLAAVPGPIDSALSAGTNRLIVDGALVVDCREALLAIAGLEGARRAAVPRDLEWAYAAICAGEAGDILARGGNDSERLMIEVARLELTGHVRRAESGGWVPTA